ncbi:MAG: glycosyltransferase [Rickettsiales bacterium]|nr:glycosyltransferase [Rickettsiales bacterium]
MRILLSLLSKDLGGMEFSFLDYLKVLKKNGHEVIVLTHELAPYLQGIYEHTDSVYRVNPKGYYDVRVWLKVKRILDKMRPDMVIAHGNKAVHLLRKASIRRYPIIAINHSNNLKRSIGSNFLVTVNRGMKESAIDQGQHPEKCAVIPNMIDIRSQNFQRKPYQSPPVIGAMGRFTVEKGFRTFIHSLSIMHNQGIDFRAVVSGDGPLKHKLHDLTKLYGIDHKVSFPGWVHNKEAFYRSIDIMCVPSRYETFGMVILVFHSYCQYAYRWRNIDTHQ